MLYLIVGAALLYIMIAGGVYEVIDWDDEQELRSLASVFWPVTALIYLTWAGMMLSAWAFRSVRERFRQAGLPTARVVKFSASKITNSTIIGGDQVNHPPWSRDVPMPRPPVDRKS